MQYALDGSGQRVVAEKGTEAECPACKARVVAKCGEIITHHWAHACGSECDSWFEPIGAWHLSWQSLWPEDCREVVIGRHRADVLTPGGTVIEFQHSTISTEEIREREEFYESMVWLFDGTDVWNRLKLWCGRAFKEPEEPEHHYFYEWARPRTSIRACEKPVYLDLGHGNIARIQPGKREPFPDSGWADTMQSAAFVASVP